MSGTLLLVEDEEHLAFTLEFNLTQEGYVVDTARTIQEARQFVGNAYDLILLDVMLPDGNGFQFCQSIRQEGNRTPVLFLTAKGSSEDIVEGLDAGADDYITKPFVLKELLARIAAVLRRKQWTAPTDAVDTLDETYTFGRVRVHFGHHTVHLDDECIELTALEFRLLQFFIAHENQAIRREDLLERVWEVSASNTTRTVDNFIVRLRRIFEEDPSNPKHFLTVRGVGYRFVSLQEE